MLSVEEALRLVLERCRQPLAPVTVPLAEAAGCVLAEDVASDLDMPPFDKAMMDGFAIRGADLTQGKGVFQVIESVMAGQTPSRALGVGQATRIMTGAPVPTGADAVIMVERSRSCGEQTVELEDKPPRPGLNILMRGREMTRGEVVLRAGVPLRPQEIGVLATVGKYAVRIQPRPQVAILSTGDEVMEVGLVPGPGQIRNSNAAMLEAQVRRAGGSPKALGIARDRLDSLRPLITEGLRSDVLVLSGGVSAGKLDLVPGVLAELGVEAIFHKVAMKPGKPVFFGVAPATSGNRLVFGLPGNPVSALVCFELFVRPALRAWQGLPPGPRILNAALTEDFSFRTDRPTYHPAQLNLGPQGLQVRMTPWFGSPDLRGILQANAFAVLPVGDQVFHAGQELPVLVVEELPVC
jgi:molybdopterin molybdotransferase